MERSPCVQLSKVSAAEPWATNDISGGVFVRLHFSARALRAVLNNRNMTCVDPDHALLIGARVAGK